MKRSNQETTGEIPQLPREIWCLILSYISRFVVRFPFALVSRTCYDTVIEVTTELLEWENVLKDFTNVFLSQFTNLRSLSLRTNEGKWTEDLFKLHSLTRLETLSLAPCIHVNKEALHGLVKLKHLVINDHNSICDENLLGLENSLESLSLSGTSEITGECLNHGFTNLTSLNLKRSFAATGINLGLFTKLKKLKLSREYGVKHLDNLNSLTNLTHLSLGKVVHVKDEHIWGLTNLTHLNVSWAKELTFNGLTSLKKLHTLKLWRGDNHMLDISRLGGLLTNLVNIREYYSGEMYSSWFTHDSVRDSLFKERATS